MEIFYLGTAAYDAIPSPFCECKVCRAALKVGGKDLRTRSQALIDGRLLIDFNADTVAHFLKYGIDGSNIDTCLITHSHSDHLYAEDIVISQYAQKWHKVHYFSAQSGYDKILSAFKSAPVMTENDRAEITLVQPFESFFADGYEIMPLEANHAEETSPLVYAIKKDGKGLLYAHDTGVFCEETFKVLSSLGHMNLISFDCTGGLNAGWRDGHMCFSTVREVVARLERDGVADEKTIKVLNHFSHNGGALYADMVAAAEKSGYIVSYDGLRISF